MSFQVNGHFYYPMRLKTISFAFCVISTPLSCADGSIFLSTITDPASVDPTFDFDVSVFASLKIAAVVNGIFFLCLIASHRFWKKPCFEMESTLSAFPKDWRTQAILLLIVTISGWLASPRLQHSLWTDEQFSLRKSLVGQFDHDPEQDGQAASLYRIYWEEADWPRGLWFYETPNTHFLFSIGARLMHKLDHQLHSDLEDWEFNERTIRIFPFLCGLLSLPAWYVCLRRLGFGKLGLFCVALMALHPWFIRTISEARGYPLMFLFMPLWITALANAAETNKWKHWCRFAFLQTLLLYSWPGTILLVVLINGSLVLCRKSLPLDPRRCLLVNIIAAMILFQLTAPCFLQFANYLKVDTFYIPMGEIWLKDISTRFLTGIDWHDHFDYSLENKNYLSLLASTPSQKALIALLGLLAFFGYLRGVKLWCKQGLITRFIAVAAILSFTVVYAFGELFEVFIFPIYTVFLLPIAIAIASTGAHSVICQLSKDHFPKKAILLTSCLALFVTSTLPATLAMRSQPLDPLRDAALAVRGTSDPYAPGQNRIITAFVGLTARAYDPLSWVVDEASSSKDSPWPGLTQLLKYADLLDSELHIHLAFPQTAEKDFPEIVHILHTPDLFEKTHTFLGLEPQYKREIYHYKGGMFDMLK
jgi:hypothetical protein